MVIHRWDHHPPCTCGCGELADECAGPRSNPLGSMRIEAPVASPWPVTCWRGECRIGCYYPTVCSEVPR